MLKPDYIARATEKAEAIAENMHNSVVNRVVEGIVTRLGRGDDYILTPSDKYRIDALQDSGEILKDIRKELAEKTGLLNKEIQEAFEDAGIKATKYDDKLYEKAGIEHGDFRQSPKALRALQRNFEATEGMCDNYTKTTAIEAGTAYTAEMNKVMSMVQSGAMSLNEAVKQAVEDIAKTGITAIHYDSGHVDSLEVAVARAVRTGISQATAQMQLERMKEMGCDLVITSSHLGARPTHEVWQGQIFHVDFKTMDITAQHKKDDPIPEPSTKSKYPDFVTSTRYGYVDGLCGANCRHHFSPYFDGMHNPFPDYDSEENKKRYEIEQKQRVYERRIRQTNREREAFKTAINECKDDSMKDVLTNAYNAKNELLTKQRKAYKEYCEENSLKEQYERIRALVKAREKDKIKKICDLPKEKYGLNPYIKKFVATINNERIAHIEEDIDHIGSYTQYADKLVDIITNPSYLLTDKYSDTAVVVLKKFDNDQVRLVIETESKDGATIRTLFHISKETLKKYIKKSDLIFYKSEM